MGFRLRMGSSDRTASGRLIRRASGRTTFRDGRRSDPARSTMRGAALLALEVCEGAEPAIPPVTRRVEPVAGRAEHYRRRLARFEALADLA